jgi:hypothetical protein
LFLLGLLFLLVVVVVVVLAFKHRALCLLGRPTS